MRRNVQVHAAAVPFELAICLLGLIGILLLCCLKATWSVFAGSVRFIDRKVDAFIDWVD